MATVKTGVYLGFRPNTTNRYTGIKSNDIDKVWGEFVYLDVTFRNAISRFQGSLNESAFEK